MRVEEAFAEAAAKKAASYLEGCGFRVLDRDWRCDGETVSIIATDQRALVAVDLRVRAGTRRGAPLHDITLARQQVMRRLAARWLVLYQATFALAIMRRSRSS
jgi:putative endonuclease